MKQTLLVLCAFCATISLAQPTITSSVIAPVGTISQYFASSGANTFNPGASGANVTWNFGTLDTALGTRTQYIVQADTTFFYFAYPSAVNYCVKSFSGIGYNFGYASLDNSKFEYYGAQGLADVRVYSDPVKLLQFPFTYNNQFSDVFYDDDDIYYGTNTVKADAYGTLTIPTGTFTNVLRINVTETYREYIEWDDFTGEPTDSAMYEGQYYRWYQPGQTSVLLEYSELVKYVTYLGVRYDVDSAKHTVFKKGTLTSLDEPVASFSSTVYPNPTSGNLFFETETPVALVQVTDICGKLLLEQDFNDKNFVLNLSHLASGTYYVQLTTTDNRRKTVKVLHL